ncbi:hypothetical protein RCO27_02645 [Sphingosinicella sp. LHD-64]|uniref:hypothetical protein n=1 Tax=Sphingosinicella sp. LHD-64 TaxID=3072139 RepID=UPI00280EFB83|nr:hypothetical protein [Sphingosinicella sp. LHD-64]MDQ8755118.1 hypothetical protein [Sphingosinicella sp. LHD-64]
MVQNFNSEPKEGLSAREIAARNRETCGKSLSNVMKTAATARELAQGTSRRNG